MTLGMQVSLGPSDFVLDGDPAHPPQKWTTEPPIFGPCLLWPNGWMHQDATWYRGRPRPRTHCARWRTSCPPPAKGAQKPPSFWPMSVVATVAHLSYCRVLVLQCIANNLVLQTMKHYKICGGQFPLPSSVQILAGLAHCSP